MATLRTQMELGAPTTRTRLQALTVAAVLGLGVVGGTATTTARADAAPTAATGDVAKDPVAHHKSFVALWNDQKYAEMGDFYTQDAIAAPPNHDIIKGRDAIVAFYKTARQVFGELQGPFEPHSVITSGSVTTIMGNYVFKNSVRVTAVEVFERQADGRYRCKLDMVGFRDPLR